MLTNAPGPALHVSKHVGNMTSVAQCTSLWLRVHGSARLCLSPCLPVFVLCRGHSDSFSNKWHSVAILLQVTQPLDFIYHKCWLQGRHRLQIVPMIICTLGTIYLYNQMTEISYSRSGSSSLEFILVIFRQLNEIAEISLTMWYLLIFAYISTEKYCKVDLVDQHFKLGWKTSSWIMMTMVGEKQLSYSVEDLKECLCSLGPALCWDYSIYSQLVACSSWQPFIHYQSNKWKSRSSCLLTLCSVLSVEFLLLNLSF